MFKQLWLLSAYEVYQQFTYINPISQPSSSTPLLLGVSRPSPRGTGPPETSEGYIVRRASHPTVASDACLPRLLLVVQQVHFLIPTSGMRPNNDTPSFRSYRFTNPLPLRAQELHTTLRPVGGDEAADWAGPDGNQVNAIRLTAECTVSRVHY